MPNRTIASILALILALSFAALATAQPVAANSTAMLVAPVPGVSVFVQPNGSGTPLSACYAPGGTVVSAAVVVTIRDAAGNPVAAVPNRDIRIARAGTGMIWCSDTWYPPPMHAPNCADLPTNAAGQTRFTLAYHGGSWHNAGMQVWVLEAAGIWAPIPNILTVNMNSPDNNGDLVVNLSDVVTFVADLWTIPAPYRSDFNWDNNVNLTDIVLLTTSIGLTCP